MTLALRDDPTACPECGTDLASTATGQPALFRHGGYGAARTTTVAHCPVCGWAYIPDESEGR